MTINRTSQDDLTRAVETELEGLQAESEKIQRELNRYRVTWQTGDHAIALAEDDGTLYLERGAAADRMSEPVHELAAIAGRVASAAGRLETYRLDFAKTRGAPAASRSFARAGRLSSIPPRLGSGARKGGR